MSSLRILLRYIVIPDIRVEYFQVREELVFPLRTNLFVEFCDIFTDEQHPQRLYGDVLKSAYRYEKN